jgi:hypothetical protein
MAIKILSTLFSASFQFFLLALGLKLCHVVDWAWAWIWVPLWAPAAAMLLVLMLMDARKSAGKW